jgi:hypothetical protein
MTGVGLRALGAPGGCDGEGTEEGGAAPAGDCRSTPLAVNPAHARGLGGEGRRARGRFRPILPAPPPCSGGRRGALAHPALTAVNRRPARSLASRRSNYVGPEGAAALAPALRGLTALTSLDLG